MTEIASESGHWYTLDGKPAYEVRGKNGEMRATNLRDARKLGLVPSVSGIIKMAAAEALERWKRNQLLMSAIELTRGPEEGVQAFADRVVQYNYEKAAKAPDLGSHIHGCIEKALAGKDFDRTYLPHVAATRTELDRWCDGGPFESEKSFAHEMGYGGKVDVHKRTRPGFGFVTDFKTKDFGPDNLPDVYDNHAMQTAAYAWGLNIPMARCSIIYVSTTVPGLTHLVEIPRDDILRGWDMFQCLLTYWQLKNRYQPKGKA